MYFDSLLDRSSMDYDRFHHPPKEDIENFGWKFNPDSFGKNGDAFPNGIKCNLCELTRIPGRSHSYQLQQGISRGRAKNRRSKLLLHIHSPLLLIYHLL